MLKSYIWDPLEIKAFWRKTKKMIKPKRTFLAHAFCVIGCVCELSLHYFFIYMITFLSISTEKHDSYKFNGMFFFQMGMNKIFSDTLLLDIKVWSVYPVCILLLQSLLPIILCFFLVIFPIIVPEEDGTSYHWIIMQSYTSVWFQAN